MTRQEFLDTLQASLTGRVSASQIQENRIYYDDYISTQVRMGKSEEQVIAGLGDPRLIAKSIIEANKHADMDTDRDYREQEYEDYQNSYRSAEQEAYGDNYRGEKQKGFGKGRVRRIPGWLIALLVVLVILCVILFVFSVVSFLAPILIPVIIIWVLFRLLQRYT